MKNIFTLLTLASIASFSFAATPVTTPGTTLTPQANTTVLKSKASDGTKTKAHSTAKPSSAAAPTRAVEIKK
jgi:hypothetical protein